MFGQLLYWLLLVSLLQLIKRGGQKVKARVNRFVNKDLIRWNHYKLTVQ